MTQARILIAVDDSETTQGALDQVVAAHAGSSTTFRLFHVVGPIPPGLLESGGSSDPEEEQRIERELSEQEAKWFAGEVAKARPMVELTREHLIAGGIDEARISVNVADCLPEDRLARIILDEAREEGCDTIVVGHHAYSWLREKFHRHVGDELKKLADDIAVIVIDA